MLESTFDLHMAMKEILEIFQNGGEIRSIFSKYHDKDLAEAINTCLSKGLLTGVSCDIGLHDDVTVNTWDPQVTTSGKAFILEI